MSADWRFTLVPTDPLIELLNPLMFFCLVIMLIIPELPSPSYLAVGLVITSTLFT